MFLVGVTHSHFPRSLHNLPYLFTSCHGVAVGVLLLLQLHTHFFLLLQPIHLLTSLYPQTILFTVDSSLNPTPSSQLSVINSEF